MERSGKVVTLGNNLWEHTARPAPATARLAGDMTADVAVIGAGFAGLSVTLHLLEAGASVALIEAGEIGAGASGRSSGQINPGFKRSDGDLRDLLGPVWAAKLIRFGDEAPRYLTDLIHQHDITCDLQPGGWVRAAHARKALKTLESTAKNLQRRKRDVRLLDAAEMETLLGTNYYVGGLLHREASMVQPLSLLRGLAEVCQQKGATIVTHSPARKIIGQDPWRLDTPCATVTARVLVLTTGAYTDDLWPGLRESVITVQSGQLASAPITDSEAGRLLKAEVGVSDTRKLANFFRKDAAGRFMIGGRGTIDRSLSSATARSILAAATKRFPAANRFKWEYAWSGAVEFNPRDLPQLCRLAPNAWSMLGFGGRGIALATALGEIVARKITGYGKSDWDYPTSELRPIKLHALRAPVIAGAMAYYRAKDALGFAS